MRHARNDRPIPGHVLAANDANLGEERMQREICYSTQKAMKDFGVHRGLLYGLGGRHGGKS